MSENQTTYNNEISVRDIILKIKSFIQEILRYWYIPAICILLALGYQAYKYYTFIPTYPAKITFSVDEEEGGTSSGLTGILGQFGLGGVRPARYNLDKIMALSKSRRVIENTLFEKTTIEGKEDFLANHLIREYDFNKRNPDIADGIDDFYFAHDTLHAFSRLENEMLISLYGFIIGPPKKPEEALINADYNEDTNIMSIDVSTTNEELSIALAERMFVSLSDYYVKKAIEKQLKTFKLVNAKKDSVLAELKSAEYQLANFRDTRRGLAMRTDQIPDYRLQREITALSAMYAEVLRNTEVADFTLKNKMPFIQVIDAPISPIEPTQISLLRKLIMGIVIGGAIGCVYVVGRQILKDMLAGSA